MVLTIFSDFLGIINVETREVMALSRGEKDARFITLFHDMEISLKLGFLIGDWCRRVCGATTDSRKQKKRRREDESMG